MNRILVWDVPTRLFHWLFAGAVLATLTIALTVDDDSGLFQIHMILGLFVGFVVVLRLIWGLVGSRYARFGSFLFGPSALIGYLIGVFRRTGERHIGHNPGSAYAAYAMLTLAIGLPVSGLLMASSEVLEELHEILAYTMLATLIAHILGVVLHTIRHREIIARSMIDGKKRGEANQAARSSHPVVGLLFLALAIGWAALLISGHDRQSAQLTVLGLTIHLGEGEHEVSEEYEGDRLERDPDDHEDEDH